MSFKLKSRWLNRTQEAAGSESTTTSDQSANPTEPSVGETFSAKDNVVNEPSSAPQLPKFSPIEENVFVTERPRCKGWKESKRMLCDCSTSPEERLDGKAACGEECLNRILFIECGPKCLCGEHCTNNRFQKRAYAKVEPFPAGQKGWGLRTAEHLKTGQFVIEYVGEVLNASSFRHRMKRYGRDPTHKHHYFMALRNDEVIDATERGNVSRFINHSCDPNCETQKWTVNGQLRIGFFVKKDIPAGEELTFDYQFERYGKEAQKCFCGSAKCRGFIGGQPSEAEKEVNKEAVRENRARERRRKAQLEDMAMEKQLNELVMLGQLRSREQVLDFCRLMVRGDEFEARMKLLDVLLNTEEPLLRLFLDYHGCWLIWSWMADEENLDKISWWKIQKKLLFVLKKLPIPHRNMLEDSRVLAVVRRWAESRKEQKEEDDVAFVMRTLVDSVVSSLSQGNESPASSSSSAADEHSSETDSAENLSEEDALIQEIRTLSQELLSGSWTQLREYFKIPKKTEAGKAARAGRRDRKILEPGIPRLLSRQSNLTPICKNSLTAVRYNQNSAGRAAAGKKLHASRSHSGSRSPPSHRKRLGRNWSPSSQKGKSANNRRETPPSQLNNQEPEVGSKSPFVGRKRPSRFDRKTPPHVMRSRDEGLDSVEYRRREFELSVAHENEEEQRKMMALEFEMAAEAAMDEDEDAMDLSSPVASPTPMDVCTSAGLGSHVTTSEGDGEAIPALFVHDPRTNRYWWQDQASGTLVYPVTDLQMAAIGRGDYTVTPHFVYNASTGLIHEVKLEIAQPVAQDPVVSSSESGAPTSLSPSATAQDQGRASGGSDTASLAQPPAGLSAQQQIEFLQRQIVKLQEKLDKVAPEAGVENDEKQEETSPGSLSQAPADKQRVLPPNWKATEDQEGNVYYYNVKTRLSQWETPKDEEGVAESSSPKLTEEKSKKLKPGKHKVSTASSEDSPAKRFHPETTTAAADTSSEVGKKQRDKFKSEISNYVIKCLHPYQKPDCKLGRITSSDDFKHLARKLSHTVLEKEMKYTVRMEDLRVTDSVKSKAKDYIKKYMKKLGPMYRRSVSASGRRSTSPDLVE